MVQHAAILITFVKLHYKTSQWTGEGFTMGLRFHYNIILKFGKFKAPFVVVSMEFR